jgi:hypothetical protein
MLSAARTCLKSCVPLHLRVPDIGDTLPTNSPPRGYPSVGVAVKHRQCSHLITTCWCRGINYKGPSYLCLWYERSNTLRVWESRFEPYLDSTQWLDYNDLDYIPDSDLVKDKKGRRKTKRLKGDMDASQGRFSSDYGTGDFEEDKSRNRFSKQGADLKGG